MNNFYRTIALVMVISLAQAALFGQSPENQRDDYPWTVQMELGGGYMGGGASGELGAALLWEYRSWLDVGVSARAMTLIDHELEDSLGRGYHMETGYGALRLRPKMNITPGWELAFPLEMGNGFLTYRYEGKYAEEMRWDEEILDQLKFAAYSIGIENVLSIGEHYNLFIRGGVRTTSPIKTDLADSDELSGFWADTGISYRF